MVFLLIYSKPPVFGRGQKTVFQNDRFNNPDKRVKRFSDFEGRTLNFLAVCAYVSILSPKRIMQNHVKSWQIMQKHAPENAWKCLILPGNAGFWPDFVL